MMARHTPWPYALYGRRFDNLYKVVKPIAAVAICLAACQPNIENDIQLQCHYMAYACGDCYPQYRVEKVAEGRAAKQELLGKDINLEFESEEKRQVFEQLQRDCP
ncbi:MAG TPA: hypothetical protein PK971_13260, partial [Saprospiraceae bacterium]|nr:hypothetical protein [Saprospiraceae bacterium]